MCILHIGGPVYKFYKLYLKNKYIPFFWCINKLYYILQLLTTNGLFIEKIFYASTAFKLNQNSPAIAILDSGRVAGLDNVSLPLS